MASLFPAFFVLSAIATQASANERVDAQPWVYDGVKKCVFDESRGRLKPEVPCVEYSQEIKHRLGKHTWSQWRYMWKYGHKFEVRYTSREGILGISDFTVGELYDKKGNFSGRKTVSAVSYSVSREELVIGVPNEGYVFTMHGELG